MRRVLVRSWACPCGYALRSTGARLFGQLRREHERDCEEARRVR